MSGGTLTSVLSLAGFAYLAVVGVLALVRPQRPILPFPWETPLGVAGFLMLIVGTWLGLYVSPPEMHMGEVGRILFVHVPAAWLAMTCFLLAPGFAFGFLMTGKRHWDSAMDAATEVGVVEGILMIVLGSIFARPTWGVWWAWDARLTTSAVMLLSFVGVMLLRGIVRDPDRRATWSAVANILSGVNVFIVYFSVQWWASLHQLPSMTTEGSAIDPSMQWILLFNTCGLHCVTVWFLARRYRLAEARADAEWPEPLPEMAK